MSEAPVNLTNKPPCDRADALTVLMRLREAGHVAYFAGGCVRDELLGLDPKDYDVATDAPPLRVRELFSNTQAVGAAFGVILVRHRKSIVEVATFRAEGPYLDGRRPSEVHFTNAEEDAKRRDFTINGLFLDPVKNEVIDYVGGQEDLHAQRLRAIGNPVARFEEDHLRILRAVRFASRFGFTIDAPTADAIRAHAEKLKRISPERIADELRLTLMPPSRRVAWPMLWELGVLSVIFRTIDVRGPGPAPLDPSIFLALEPGVVIDFGLALAAGALCYRWKHVGGDLVQLLDRDDARATVRALRHTLKISNDESGMVEDVLDGAGRMLVQAPTLALKKRFLTKPHASQTLQLMDGLAAIGCRSAQIAQLRSELDELQKTEFAPPPLLTGDDLTAAGYKPGPTFKKVLEAVYDAQLEGDITTRETALDRARQMLT